MIKELYNEIDLLVKELIENGVVSENKENSKIRSKSIQYLKANGFLKPAKSRLQYHPASEIYDIEKVGIEQYLKNKESDQETESKIKKKTLFDFNIKYFMNFALVVFSAYLGWLSKSFYLEKEEKHTTEKLNKVISEKNDLLIQIQTHLNEKNKIIFSLRKELDSLKNK